MHKFFLYYYGPIYQISRQFFVKKRLISYKSNLMPFLSAKISGSAVSNAILPMS